MIQKKAFQQKKEEKEVKGRNGKRKERWKNKRREKGI